MKFCIYGAGAIGGYLAVELSLAGHEVCVIARGAHLQVIQQRGLTLQSHGTTKLARVAAEGFRVLGARLTRVLATPAATRADTLAEMGVAYVRFALENQAHYQTMFGGYLQDWSAYPDLILQAEATFSLLADAVTAEQRQGRMVAGDPVELAEVMWSLTHGIVTLGAAGQLKHSGRPPEALVRLGCAFLGRSRTTTPKTAKAARPARVGRRRTR